jgi:actin-like ATPase involved in cell morphogenesis
MLVGNGSKISNLREMIEAETKIHTIVADDSGMVVIRGCGRLVEDKALLKRVKLVAG